LTYLEEHCIDPWMMGAGGTGEIIYWSNALGRVISPVARYFTLSGQLWETRPVEKRQAIVCDSWWSLGSE